MKAFMQRLARHQRRWFGRWHLWLGLSAGLVMAIIGLSGSVLAFREEIDAALNPTLFTVPAPAGSARLPFDEVLTRLARQQPARRFYGIRYATDQPGAAYIVYGKKRTPEWFVNPYTGAVLGQRDREQSFVGFVLRLHRTLLLPGEVGGWVVGLASLTLLLLTISGLRLWLPRKWQHLRAALGVKFGASFQRQNFDWHNVLGLYSAPVVVALTLSGLAMTLSALIIPLLYVLSFQSPKPWEAARLSQSAYRAGARALPVGQVLAACQQAVPGGTVQRLALPQDSVGVYQVNIWRPGAHAAGRRELLRLDQYSGRVLFNSTTDVPDLGRAYLSWVGPVHFGTFGGLPTRVLALL
ncbi:MAG: PepSY domain-containing protein, partial [Hymenobacter sp.]